MKKLLAFLFSFGMVTSLLAQSRDRTKHEKFEKPGKSNDRNVYSNNDRRYDNDYHSKEKAAQIHRINREFDAKVTAVRNKRRMRPFEKSRQIRMLENERMEQIRKVNARYSRSNDRYDDYSKAGKKKW